MILVRFVCQARFGQASEAVAVFKQSQEIVRQEIAPALNGRILTDLSGPFDTVILEIEVESLAEWQKLRTEIYSNPQVQQTESALFGVIDSGQTEYYTIEASWH